MQSRPGLKMATVCLDQHLNHQLQQPSFFFLNFLHKCLMLRCNLSNHPWFLLATPSAHRQGLNILSLRKLLICQKSILLDFDILHVRHELPDAARHVTRRRARPPMSPFRKLGHCTDMLHSNHLHMTTLFTISIKTIIKLDILLIAFTNQISRPPPSYPSPPEWLRWLCRSPCRYKSWLGSIITRIPVYNWGWQS